MIEFILPILSMEIPKRLNITMANTLFGAMSGVRPVNWGKLIHEYVEKSLPHMGGIHPTSPPTSSISTNTTTASPEMKRICSR